jgi:hypothetical protein
MTTGQDRRRRKASARAQEPGVIRDAEREVGLASAAADAAELAAQWAAMSVPEQNQFLVMHGDGGACDDEPGDGSYDGGDGGGNDAGDALFRVVESGWLALAADGSAGVTDRELLAIATAEQGSLGEPGRYGDPRDGSPSCGASSGWWPGSPQRGTR